MQSPRYLDQGPEPAQRGREGSWAKAALRIDGATPQCSPEGPGSIATNRRPNGSQSHDARQPTPSGIFVFSPFDEAALLLLFARACSQTLTGVSSLPGAACWKGRPSPLVRGYGMSALIVIVYPSEQKAGEIRQRLLEFHKEYVIEPSD